MLKGDFESKVFNSSRKIQLRIELADLILKN